MMMSTTKGRLSTVMQLDLESFSSPVVVSGSSSYTTMETSSRAPGSWGHLILLPPLTHVRKSMKNVI